MVASLHARVNGAGPTGGLAALALASAGWRVSLFDPLDAAALRQRSRAYAFTHSSRRLWHRLGLWEALLPHLVPFRHLQLHDLGVERSVQFGPADLGPRSAQDPQSAVGWIGLHGALMDLLLERLAAHPAVELCLGGRSAAATPSAAPAAAASGATAAGSGFDLVVAADGSDSPTRQSLGIGQWHLPYRQACVTVQVELQGAAPSEAWELLRPEGPFAVLPLGEQRFQLVWSAPPWRCRQLESLPDASFLDGLAGALPDRLQPYALHDQPRAFPVALQLARRLHRGNTVLVGESAHRCHPVGGQGLNLCWRDVEVLHGLAERAGRSGRGGLDPRRIGAAYAWRRWPDLLLTLLATDLMVRLFSNRSPLLLPLRRVALALLAGLAPLRRVTLALMSHGPLPQRATAATVTPW
jgi:2-octaprenyl-6-methoxyphenol hydroxylase